MDCVMPPELGDRELLAYLDGEAGHQVVVHLEQCPHCRERAEQLAQLQGRMTAELYRITCPSTMELGEYHLGLLPGDRSAAVSRHLMECPHCSGELAQLKGYLGELAPELEFSPMERIKVLVARLVGDRKGRAQPGAPTLAPAYAGVRGGENGPRIYQAGDAQIVIEIQDDAMQPGRKALLGLIMGIEPRDLVGHLWLGDQPVAQAPVDELGNLSITNLAPDSYELILKGPDLEIQIQDLDVGAS
jgi:anti-sigma factor RsiW